MCQSRCRAKSGRSHETQIASECPLAHVAKSPPILSRIRCVNENNLLISAVNHKQVQPEGSARR